jgi:hypothetical protein
MVPFTLSLMRIQQVRKLALSLPGATEEPHFDKTSFRIGRKIFATVPPSDGTLHVFVDEDETRACVAQDPKVFEELWWGKRLVGLRVSLPDADADQVRELLEDAWRRKAPKRLTAAFDSRK